MDRGDKAMKKNDLIDTLKEALRTEERAISVYTKHLNAFCTRFQIDKIYIDKIKKTLSYLIQGEYAHRKVCLDLIEQITKDNKSDY